jgi:hypothetical protein
VSIESGFVGVQLTLDEIPPQWAANYDDPVICAKTGSGKFHEPDLSAPEPAPACECGNRDVEWNVWERDVAEDWRDRCGSCEREVADVE